MRPPVITIVLRGYEDRYGFKKLFLRYSWSYRTNYMVLPWKLLEKDWDQVNQCVRPRATLGGETSVIVNSDLKKRVNEAFSVVAELIASGIPPTFEEFRLKMGASKIASHHFYDSAIMILADEFKSKEISKASFVAYKSALNKFKELEGNVRLHEISREKIISFKRKLVMAGKENLANQYIKYLKVIFNRVIRHFGLSDVRKPFENVEIKVVKISQKKSLSIEEYTTLREALSKYQPGSVDYETIRRFLIMCRGLRFSDTQHITKEHYFEFQEGDVTYRYFTTHAQKTGSKEIVPISERDALLLQWQPDGRLFQKVEPFYYRKRLKKLSMKHIGREITSHYGRHFTGDFILNSGGGMTLDDVKTILGVKSDRVAEIYAQKDIKDVLRKFYAAVADLETKSK